MCANVNKDGAGERWNFEVRIGVFYIRVASSALRYLRPSRVSERASVGCTYFALGKLAKSKAG